MVGPTATKESDGSFCYVDTGTPRPGKAGAFLTHPGGADLLVGVGAVVLIRPLVLVPMLMSFFSGMLVIRRSVTR